MDDKFLNFLYNESQQQDALEAHLHELLEALESTEKIKLRRKPLEKAVRGLGVAEGDFEVEEGIVLSLVFDNFEEFRKAAAVLGDVNQINSLAEEGWVAVIEGDVAGQTEEGVFRINFVPVDEAEMSDETPKPGDNKLVKKAADEMNEPGTEDITSADDRRDIPKGIGRDASQFEATSAKELVDRLLNEGN